MAHRSKADDCAATMANFVAILFVLLALSPSALPPQLASASAATGTTVIILAGQSNMSGRGGATNNTWDHVVPPDCRSNPSILRFTANLRWEKAAVPLHSDIDVYAVCGVGPGMPFANRVLRSRPNERLGLVPCAIGNTRIDQWQKGTEFYDKTVERAKAAATGGGKIGAVLWYQGESDTVRRSDAVSYAGKMDRLVQDLRADLGIPNLLFIQVALASGQGPYLKVVRKQQMKVRERNLVTVDAKGLEISGDYVHLTTNGQVHLGRMLADAYLRATAG